MIFIAHSLGRFPSMLEQHSASHWLHCGHTAAYWLNFMAPLVTLPLLCVACLLLCACLLICVACLLHVACHLLYVACLLLPCCMSPPLCMSPPKLSTSLKPVPRSIKTRLLQTSSVVTKFTSTALPTGCGSWHVPNRNPKRVSELNK